MNSWIKQNIVLVIGMALPLLLIVLFFLATVLPKSLSTPPQYPLLFTVAKYEGSHRPEFSLSFNVKNKRLMVTSKKNDDQNNYNITKLIAYDAKNETVHEIIVDASQLKPGVETPVAEAQQMVIDTSTLSPDGYTLEGPSYSGGGLVGGLFGGGYSNSHYRLKKGAVAYKVPNQQRDYYYNQLQFVGWMIKK
jgi:hypothetical protein